MRAARQPRPPAPRGAAARTQQLRRRDRGATATSAVGRRYGVSDNAIRKWVRRYERERAASRPPEPRATDAAVARARTPSPPSKVTPATLEVARDLLEAQAGVEVARRSGCAAFVKYQTTSARASVQATRAPVSASPTPARRCARVDDQPDEVVAGGGARSPSGIEPGDPAGAGERAIDLGHEHRAGGRSAAAPGAGRGARRPGARRRRRAAPRRPARRPGPRTHSHLGARRPEGRGLCSAKSMARRAGRYRRPPRTVGYHGCRARGYAGASMRLRPLACRRRGPSRPSSPPPRRRRRGRSRSCRSRRCARACTARATRSSAGTDDQRRSTSRCSTSSTARPSGDGPRILVQRVRAGGRRDRDRPGLLRLADLLPGRRRRAAEHRRDLGVDRRVRRQGRAGDADRGDPRHAGRRAAPAERDAAPAAQRARARAGRRLRRAARPLAAPLTVSGLSAPLGRALERGRREGRPAGARGARRAARQLPAADAAAGLGGRRRLLERRRAHRRDRHRRLRRRRPGLGVRPPARGRRRARAAAPGRLRLPGHQQPARDRAPARRTSSPSPGTTSGTLSNDGLDAVAGRVGALPHDRRRSGCSPTTRTPAPHATSTPAWPTRPRSTCRAAARARPSRRSPSSQAATQRARQHARPADRRHVRADLVRRASSSRALLQPLRLDALARPTTAALGNAVALSAALDVARRARGDRRLHRARRRT